MSARPSAAAPATSAALLRAARVVALALLTGYGVVFASALIYHVWPVTPQGGPGHIDFAEFWSAGRAVVTGHAADAYDWSALRRLLDGARPGAFGTTAFPFFYPPPVLLGLAPLGLMPFALAAAAWMAFGLAAYGAAVWLAARERDVRLLALASPAAFICLAVGQNGLLTSALAGGSLAVYRRRPILAGVMIGLLAMKPQLAVLAPVAMLAAGRWKTLASAVVTGLALSVAATAAFGPSIWLVCLHALHPAAGQAAPMTGLPPAKLQSVYGLARVLGLATGAAMAAQVISALSGLAYTVWLWRSERPMAQRAAGLCFAALLISPYNCVYDLAITGVGLAYLLGGEGARPLARCQAVVAAVGFLLPLAFFVRPFPYGPLICAALCAVVAVQALPSRQASVSGLRRTARARISEPWANLSEPSTSPP